MSTLLLARSYFSPPGRAGGCLWSYQGKRSGSAKVTATFAIPGNKKYAMLGNTKFTHVAELVLDKEYAKEYLYKDSTKHRVHRYKDTKVNVYV